MLILVGCLDFLAICVGCGVLVAVIDKLDRFVERRARRARRVDPMKLDERIAVLPDPVEQAYASTGIALGDDHDAERHRMTALGERIGVERLCIEISREIERYRRGEDITSGAPKEQT